MKTENKLRFTSLMFSSYSFLITFFIIYINIRQDSVISPLEISALLQAGVAIFLSMIADIISLFK